MAPEPCTQEAAMGAYKAAQASVSEAELESGVTHRLSDPFLAAVERAPLVPATEEELALLDEIERAPGGRIPHEELVAALDLGRER